MTKHEEVLVSIIIQDDAENAYVFTLWARPSDKPRYTVEIGRMNNDFIDLGFAVDLHSLQKLTVWFAKAALRASKSGAIKNTEIQHATEKEVILFTLLDDPPSGIGRCQLDIDVLATPGDRIKFVVDPYGLQKLTAWFAKAVVRVSKHEADHPYS